MKKGLNYDGFVFDTDIAAYLLDPTANTYNLASLAEHYCGFKMISGGDENGQLSLMQDVNMTVEIMQNTEAVCLLTEELGEK